MVKRVAALMALVLLLAGVAGAQQEPIEIDAVLPLTGFGAFFGKAQASSLQAFEAMTNREGGVDGRPIQFVVADDETNPQIAVQLFNQIIAKHASVVIGPSFTATCGAVLPLIANGPLTYCLSPGIHPAAGSYMFAANVATTDLVDVKFQYMRAKHWTRLATILTNDASGQDVARQVDDLLALPESRELHLVSRQTFNLADLSVTAQMTNIKAASPDVLLTAATGAPFGTLLRGAHDVGLDVPIIASGSNMTPEQMTAYAAFMPTNLLFANPRGVVVERGAAKPVRDAQAAFFDAFAALKLHPGQGETIPWDPASLIVDALRHLGPSASAEQVRAYISGLDSWVGTSGPYDFRKIPQRGIGADATVMYRWDPTIHDYAVVSKPGGKL